MKCPKCGKEMMLGEITNTRGDAWLYWAPKAFFDNHWFNQYSHTRKTIENEGGMIIKAHSKLQKATVCFGCVECKLLVVDCN